MSQLYFFSTLAVLKVAKLYAFQSDFYNHLNSIAMLIQRLHRVCSNLAFIIPIIFSFILFSCQKGNVDASGIANYSEEEIFQGILFGYGEVGAQLPQLEDARYLASVLPEEHQKELAVFVDEFTTAFMATGDNKKLVTDLKSAIMAKDLPRVKGFLVELSSRATDFSISLLEEQVKKIYNTDALLEQEVLAQDDLTYLVELIKNKDTRGLQSHLAYLDAKVKDAFDDGTVKDEEQIIESRTIGFTIACVYSIGAVITLGLVISTAAVVGVVLLLASEVDGVFERSAKDGGLYMDELVNSLTAI